MWTRTVFLSLALWCSLSAQSTVMEPQPAPELTLAANGSCDLEWVSVTGRSYFIQFSENLTDWQYFPYLELGTGQALGGSLSSTGDRFFVRLKYTDIPTTDPKNADFDEDDLTNWAEVDVHHTDPFLADTDGDSLLDGWEVAHGLDPNDNGIDLRTLTSRRRGPIQITRTPTGTASWTVTRTATAMV